jgi:hypothetical protein
VRHRHEPRGEGATGNTADEATTVHAREFEWALPLQHYARRPKKAKDADAFLITAPRRVIPPRTDPRARLIFGMITRCHDRRVREHALMLRVQQAF